MTRFPARSAFALSIATAVAGTALTAVPASAQTRWFHDPVGDTTHPGYGDIAHVVVHHKPKRVRIGVIVAPGTDLADIHDIRFDTRKGNPGPEFLLTHYEGAAIYRVDRWSDMQGPVRCSPPEPKRYDGGTRLVFTFRRACLKINGTMPARFRVNVVTWQEDGVDDRLPGKRRWTGWVKAG